MGNSKRNPVIFNFLTSSEAWAFMRVCDAMGASAGFPERGRNAEGELTGFHGVQVSAKGDRELARAVADRALEMGGSRA